MKTIGIYQSFSKNALYEHKCLKKIKNVYKHAGKCDYQKQFKDIIEADMFSTTEVFTNNSTISPMTSTPAKKLSARNSMRLFTNILDPKNRTATCRSGASKSK